MRPDEYRRLRAACLIMARQSKMPEVQTRWLVIAQASLERERTQRQARTRGPRPPLEVLFFETPRDIESAGD
jgi:hypothetical protein